MSDLKMSECAKCKCIPELMDRRTGFFVRCQCEAGENVTYGQSVSFLDHINIDGDDDLIDKLGNAAFESVSWDKLKQSAIDAWEAKQLIAKQQEQIELYKSAFEAANAKLGEIGFTLCNEGLGVAGWHQNGGMEEMDTIFNDNDWGEVDIDEIKDQIAATAKG